jgi:predicted O-methyltransferase YrrM
MATSDSLSYAENHSPEDDHLALARRNAQTVGVVPVLPGARAALEFFAAAIGAKAVAEIGTGTGVSGLAFLRGMGTEGVLTSVDFEAENQRLAREAFQAAGIPATRFRLITGSALEVLPRLIDSGYDIVFVDGEKTEYSEFFNEALRLTRPGGLIIFDNALWHDRVADPSQRDPETTSIRELIERISADETLTSVVLPVGDGLLAVRTAG